MMSPNMRIDVNSERSDSESEFKDDLHSEYAPQGAIGAAQEPATGRASQTYLFKNGQTEWSSSPVRDF